jgi:hypothetical protein
MPNEPMDLTGAYGARGSSASRWAAAEACPFAGA